MTSREPYDIDRDSRCIGRINALFTTGLAVACRPLLAEFAADELHDGLLAGVADSGIDSAHLNRSPSITS